MEVNTSYKSSISAIAIFCIFCFWFTQSIAQQHYYFDATAGNDANAGTSSLTPWQNLSKIYNLTITAGSTINLKSGSVWTGQQLKFKGSGTALSPIIVNQYGSGAKPLLHGNGLTGEGVVYLYNQQYIEINNLEITNSPNGPVNSDFFIGLYSTSGTNPNPLGADRRGVMIVLDGYGTANHIYLKNLDIHHIKGQLGNGNSSVNGAIPKRTGGIYFAVLSTLENSSSKSRFSDVLIDSCNVSYCENIGLAFDNEYNVYYPGGQNSSIAADRTEYTNWFNRRFSNVLIRKNVIHHIGKNAMIIRCTDSTGLIEQNICYETALGTTGNTMFTARAKGTVFQYNEGYFNRATVQTVDPGTIDGSMYDPDLGSVGVIFQYSYSHDNSEGIYWGCNTRSSTNNTTGIPDPGDVGCTLRYCVSQNDKGDLVFLNYSSAGNEIYNNVFYIKSGLSPNIIHENSGNNHTYNYYNNIIYNLSSATSGADFAFGSGSGVQTANISNNVFYGNHHSTEPADPFKLTSNPNFVNPGSGSTGINTLAGYKLNYGSPSINSGKLIASNGGFDYFGNTVSLVSPPNRGIYQGVGIGAPLPVITSFSPTTAPSGSTIIITGSNFTGATAISFGGTAATSFTVVNATTISAVVASGTSGNVVVTTLLGSASLPGFVYCTAITPSVSVTPSANNICLGTSVTFVATPVNGGASPSYQWKKGIANVGTNSATYIDAGLANGDVITCIMTSNATCLTTSNATSLPVTMTVIPLLTPAVTLSIKSGNNPTCDGGKVILQASPTNGGSPITYQWFLNGNPDPGNSTDTLLLPNITSAITVYAIMTAGSGVCINTGTATSPATTINTIPNSWTGAVSNSWSEKMNWCANVVPNAGTDVYIPVTSRNPVLSGSLNGQVDNINIAPGASLTISNITLNVAGSVTGTGTFSGDGGLNFTKSGNVGTLYFGTSGIKTLSFTGSSASAALGNTCNIYGELNIGSASLNSGGNLTMKSDRDGTSWVAPVTGGAITGNVTVERYIPQNAFRAWRLLSVPVQGTQTFKQAWQENQSPMANGIPGYGTLLTSAASGNGYDTLTSGNSLLQFTNGIPGVFSPVSNTNNTMATKSGYFLYVRGDRSVGVNAGVFNAGSTTLRVKGALYVGAQSPVSVPANVNVMIGNVYASPLDFALLTKTGITSFKVWDPKLQGTYNVGGYQTFSAVNGYDPTPGGGSYGNTPNSRIESGQAFLVSAPAGGSVQITESAKASGSKNVFRAKPQVEQCKIRLYALNGDSSSLADGCTVVFDKEFSNGMDYGDVIKVSNIGENLGIKRNGQILTIETRKKIACADTIPLLLSNLKTKAYAIELTSMYMESGMVAYLLDKVTGTKTAFCPEKHFSISFNCLNISPAATEQRFSIIFQNKIRTNTAIYLNAIQLDGQSYLTWNQEKADSIHTYEIEHSTDGTSFLTIKCMTSDQLSMRDQPLSFVHATLSLGNHFYRIKAISANGLITYSNLAKIVLVNNLKGVRVFPNPVKGNRIRIEFIGQKPGEYTCRLFDKEGKIMFTTTVILIRQQRTAIVAIPSFISSGMYNLEILSKNNLVSNTNLLMVK